MSKEKLDTPPSSRGGIVSVLRSLARRHDLHRVFSDWVEMMALAISNKFDLARYDAREARYLRIVKAYGKEELNGMCRAMAGLTMLLEREPEDQMSRIFHELEIGNSHMGQFFTPWTVSYMMAKMTLGSKEQIEKLIAEHGFFTACEPACGAGGMIVAMAAALRDEGVAHDKMHVMAVDIDRRCVHMSYVQCSLLGIPAIVCGGDTLRMEFSETWYTPAHVMGLWSGKLRRHGIDERSRAWWRAITIPERITFLQNQSIDVGEAAEHVPSRVVRDAHQRFASETA